jgi:hypothetical protein
VIEQTSTYEIRLSARYADDHLETSSLPGTFVSANGRGLLIRFTLGELHELYSRADYYTDRHYGRELAESGFADLHRSAIKVVEQIKRADLWELARSDEARAAYNAEWDAMRAESDRLFAELKAERAAAGGAR